MVKQQKSGIKGNLVVCVCNGFESSGFSDGFETALRAFLQRCVAGRKPQQRVMCVRAGVRLPSPRALTGQTYIIRAVAAPLLFIFPK